MRSSWSSSSNCGSRNDTSNDHLHEKEGTLDYRCPRSLKRAIITENYGVQKSHIVLYPKKHLHTEFLTYHLICIRKCKRFRNTRRTVTFGIQFSRDTRSVDFRRLRMKLSLSYSTVASETPGRPGDLVWHTEHPVSTNSCTTSKL
jgi:hypothetical protein